MAKRVCITISLPPDIATELKKQPNISEYIRRLILHQPVEPLGQKNNSITEDRVREIVSNLLRNYQPTQIEEVDKVEIDILDALESIAK